MESLISLPRITELLRGKTTILTIFSRTHHTSTVAQGKINNMKANGKELEQVYKKEMK